MKRVLDLSVGHWELVYNQPGEAPDWTTAIPAQVPGGVLLDLHRAGLVPDPFYAENFRACRWTEEWTFWYRNRFRLPANSGQAKHELHFDGIDTHAEVFLNGASLGRVANMFRRHALELPANLSTSAEHELMVRIDPWQPATRAWMAEAGINLEGKAAFFGIMDRLAARKMQQAFGWDNTPRLLAGGIFRPVSLVSRSGPYLGDHAWTVEEVFAETRSLQLIWTGTVGGAQPGLRVRISGHHTSGHCFTGESVVTADGRWRMSIVIREARLWWPNGMGAPDTYEVQLRLLAAEGQSQDLETLAIGLRQVRVRTSPVERRIVRHRIGMALDHDADGGAIGPWARQPLAEPVEVEVRPFNFEINGRPFFIKGCNWQPTCAIPGGATREQTETLLDSAVAANLNLLRIWGGGLVECPEFYEGCTRRGLLVWQDFFFACGQFPREPAFLAEIAEEADDIVRRLRNHTCLAAWCGDNEADMIDHDRGLDPALNPINKRILPETLARLDPQRRHYHPSSPSSPGIADHPRSDWSGDKRNWGAWQPRGNYAHIRQEEARLMSEGGSYALPDRETIEAFMPPGLRWPLHYRTWRLHTGDLDSHARAFWKLNFECWAHFGEPRDLEEAIALTQFAQAWGYKLLMERCRQRWPDCGGAVLWKLNDTWPCVDAGLFDYFLRPRLAYDFVKAACAPVAVSLTQDPVAPDEQVQLWLCHEGNGAHSGRYGLSLGLLQPDGSMEYQKSWSGSATVAANSAAVLIAVSLAGVDAARACYQANWTSADGRVTASALYTLTPRTAWLWHQNQMATAALPVHAHD